MIDTLLSPMNWCTTYGPYELHNWQEYMSFCEQLCNDTAFYQQDVDDFNTYDSIMEVI